MPVLASCARKVSLCRPALNGNTLGLIESTPSGRPTHSPPRPFTTDHCHLFVVLPVATSKMSSNPPSAETTNDPFGGGGPSTLHQMMQLLKTGMSTVNVADPCQPSAVATNSAPDALGSAETTIGETTSADSASKGK